MDNKHAIHKQLTTHNPLFTKSAFTLAETLIVMGIIGVVAALTLPNLNSSTGDKEKVVKLQKIYSNLNDAMGRAIAVYGPYNEWGLTVSNSEKFLDRLSDFLKISKNCGSGDSSCIDMDNIKSLNPSTGLQMAGGFSGVFMYKKSFILADGVSLTTTPTEIVVDIDGPNKGANTWGKDFFQFTVDADTGEIFPYGYNDLTDTNILNRCVKVGTYCGAWIIQYGNADYLKVDSSGKCANDKVLSTTNTSCK